MVGLCRFGDAQLTLQACRDTGFAILLAGGGSSSCWSNALVGLRVLSWQSQRQAPSCPCSPRCPFFEPQPFGRPRSKLGHVLCQQLLHLHRWRLKLQWHSGASVGKQLPEEKLPRDFVRPPKPGASGSQRESGRPGKRTVSQAGENRARHHHTQTRAPILNTEGGSS